jgi:rhomboid protease GluP
MYATRKTRRFWPWATIVVSGATALITGMQFVHPGLLAAMERRPGALGDHQYWRLFTPLFVHSDGWRQIAFNFPAIACTGYFVERIYGYRFWLVCYFLSGVMAELIAFSWQPTGAGASVAGAGLLGALAVFGLLRTCPPQVMFGALFILFGAVVLTCIRDIHGPPILIGACIGSVAARFGRHDGHPKSLS